MKNLAFWTAALSSLLFSGCDLVNDLGQNQPFNSEVYYWISSDADTFVECNTQSGGCSGDSTDHSGFDFLSVTHNENSIKRSYINFPKITFPQGTEIQEAYFELFHNAKNEDGKSDDILIDVNRVHINWNAGTIRYSNQPIPTGNGAEFNMKMKSQNWCGTINISTEMQTDLMGVSDFQGFLVSIQNFFPGYEKGFCSGNHRSHTLTDLGLAPRLLLRVKLPNGQTNNDVLIGPGHTDGSGTNFIGYRFQTGNSWPVDWKPAHLN